MGFLKSLVLLLILNSQGSLPSPISLRCFHDVIRIDVSARYLDRLKVWDDVTVYASEFDMTDDACSAKLVNLTLEGKPPVYRIEIREPFHSCGTVARIIGNPSSRNRRIAFQNRLWWVQRKNNDVTMPFRLSDIECVFSNESFIEKAIKPICCDAVTLFNTSSGDVRVKMELWKDPPEPHAAQRSLSPPFLYELGQDLFVSIRLIGSENIRLQSCYLSSGFDGRSNRNLLIGNGCPVANASRVLKTGNGSMTSFVFPVVMVQTLSFYVNCDITICINPCIPNCTAVRPVINASPSLTKGPVHIHFPATQTSSVTTTTSTMTSQSQRTKGPNYVIPILLILSITACVLLLGALCYNLSRSHGAARRHQIQRRLRKSTFGGSQIDLYKMKTEEAIDTGVD